eukprot:11049923-Lingulodinium_polyedra.AAC.1
MPYDCMLHPLHALHADVAHAVMHPRCHGQASSMDAWPSDVLVPGRQWATSSSEGLCSRPSP